MIHIHPNPTPHPSYVLAKDPHFKNETALPLTHQSIPSLSVFPITLLVNVLYTFAEGVLRAEKISPPLPCPRNGGHNNDT